MVSQLVRDGKIDSTLVHARFGAPNQVYPLLDLALDAEHFDYGRFELEWLRYFSRDEHKRLASNANARSVIVRKLKDWILNALKDDELAPVYTKILLEHYID